MTGETGMSQKGRDRRCRPYHLAECSRKWRLRQGMSDGRLLTDGIARRAAAAWTTTADGADLAGLIPMFSSSEWITWSYAWLPLNTFNEHLETYLSVLNIVRRQLICDKLISMHLLLISIFYTAIYHILFTYLLFIPCIMFNIHVWCTQQRL